MANITTREVGVSAVNRTLTNAELDNNFINLNTDIGTRIPSSEKGSANGVASLDATGKVPTAQLPSYVDDVLEAANLAAFPVTGEAAKIYVALDTNKTYRWSGSAYVYITSGAVDSVAGKTGVVTLVKGDVGLGNVDNTSDASKPISTATQTALNAKQATLVSGTSIKTVNSQSILGSGNIQIDGGVTSFNTRTGAVTLSGTDVTTALGFTPLSNATSYLPIAGGTLTGRTIVNVGGRALTIGGAPSGTPNAVIAAHDGYLEIVAGAGGATNKSGVVFHNPDISTSILEYVNTTSDAAYFNFRSDDVSWNVRVNNSIVLHASNISSYALPLSGGTLTGNLSISTGSVINFAGQSDTVGYNSTSGLGTYIKGTGSTYIYGGGSFYDGTAQRALIHAGNKDSYTYPPASHTHSYLPLSGGDLSGVLTINSTSDNQLLLQSTDSWTGIGFNDSAFLPTEYIWHNGTNGTFALGGGGANVSGKKLHVHGGMTVGANYAATTNPTNGLNVEGAIQQAGNQVLHVGNYNSYALPLSGGTLTGGLTVARKRLSFSSSYDDANHSIYNNYTNIDGEGGWDGMKMNVYNGLRIRTGNGSGAVPTQIFGLDSSGIRVDGGIRQGNNLARPLTEWSASGSSTGMVYIEMPGSSPGNYGMVHAVIDVYEYNGNAAATIIVGGHNWSGSWYNVSCNVIGATNKQVRLAVRNGKFVICLGDASSVWEYGTVMLRKIHNGSFYNNIMDMGAQFVIAQTTSEGLSGSSGDIRALRTPASFNAGGAITQAGNQVLHAGNYTSYSPSLGGSGASGTWGISVTGSANSLNLGGHTITNSSWAGGSGYHGYQYNGGSYRFGFSSTGGVLDVYADGNFYATDSSHLVLHAGNYSSYALPVSGGTVGDLRTNFLSGGGGHYFGSSHYSMGKDTANGGWSHPHYSDLIIGYHTGIRIGASYSGIRFYNNSPTTDANNDGNGDGGEALLMTIGGHAGGSDVIINNSLQLANSNLKLSQGDGTALRVTTAYGYLNFGPQNTSWCHLYSDRPFYTNQGIWINNSRVLDAGNYTSYSPSLGGSGASGTWSISINGNAATASTATSANKTNANGGYARVGYGMAPFYNWGGTNAGAGAPSDSTYTTGIDVGSHPSDQAYGFQIASNMWNVGLWTRTYNSGFSEWVRLLDSSNYTSYSPSLTGGGASGTWGISITGNSATTSQTTFSEVYTNGWLRNNSSNTGLYNQATGNHWYSDGQYWNVGYSGTTGIRLRNGHAGTVLGYLYAETSGNFGLLHNGAGWAVQVYSGGNGYLHGTWNGGNIRANRANGNLYIDDNYGYGIVGTYASTRYQGVFAMGDSYKLPADGTGLGTLYGIAWSHPNAGGAAGNLTDHGMLIINNGSFRCAISNSIVASANITAYSDERLKTNWRDMPENYVARLAQVKVGIYDRTDQENITQVGVSAQSFQKLLPESIMVAKDDMQTLSVNYGGAALASTVELAKDNVELRARIERLEALIEQLLNKE